jgi:hypothetical protein
MGIAMHGQLCLLGITQVADPSPGGSDARRDGRKRRGRRILRLSFDLPHDTDVELPERLRRLREDVTPRVQMLEDGALVDLTGATRWWQRDARGIIELVHLRASQTSGYAARLV